MTRLYTRIIPKNRIPIKKHDFLQTTPNHVYIKEPHECTKKKQGIRGYSSIVQSSSNMSY